MLTTITLLGLHLAAAPVACGDRAVQPQPGDDPDFAALYAGGRTYAEFRDDARRRRRAWTRHYDDAVVPDAVRTRVAQVPGQWKLLVVAEDWCGDSANTVPYIAKLVDTSPHLDLRIVDSEVGRPIMEAHRTPDGRAATPTVVLLNDAFANVGCWVERPSTLQSWFLENPDGLEEDALYDAKYDWYRDDAGATTLDEIVTMIERAVAGDPPCAG